MGEPHYTEADFEIQIARSTEGFEDAKDWCARPQDWEGLVTTLKEGQTEDQVPE